MATRGLAMSLIGLCLLSGLGSSPVHADFVFGTPENLGPTINTSFHEASACTSADSLSLAFWRGATWNDIGGYCVTIRETKESPWDNPVDFGPYAESYLNIIPMNNVLSFMTADGLEFYLTNVDVIQPSEYGGTDLCIYKRETTDDDWDQPMNLGPIVNSAYNERWPSISRDGLELYFCSNRLGGEGERDIWVTKRATRDSDWTDPVNLGQQVNSVASDDGTCLSSDGLVLFFDSRRPGGYGSWDLYMSKRASRSDPWEVAINLGPVVNTPGLEEVAHISADGSTLYFDSDRPGGYGGHDIWQVPITPIVDLNGDGIVDAADMCIIVDNWGTDNKLCDIGPTPLGDGIVDVQDLIVLAEHLFEEYPPAESVEVNEDNNGGQFELERGQILVVTLESNPSTGYKWELAEQSMSILLQLAEVEFKSSDTGNPPTVGAGGWEIFRFRAVSAGQMPLLLFYHRSSEDAEPLNTFIIQVTVN